MSTNDNAVMKVSLARFYTAPVGTARPTTVTDLTTPPAPWVEVGNTTLDQIFSISSQGGDVTNLGSIQNANLRQSVSPRTESFSLHLLEWTTASLKLYYGANSVITADGAVQTPTTPIPTELAFLAVLFDGENVAGAYAAKSSIFREADIAVNDTSSLAHLPIKITALNMAGGTSAITIIPPMINKRTATGTATVSSGAVTGVTITDQGNGYSGTSTTVTFGGSGTGATATAEVSGGKVIGVSITAGGTGYTTAPTVTFGAP